MILYHGLTDPDNRTPQNTIDYYGGVLVGEWRKSAKLRVRFLFLAPGMDHCSGGVGPSTFDARKSLVDWVEHDEGAPEMILATLIFRKVLARRE